MISLHHELRQAHEADLLRSLCEAPLARELRLAAASEPARPRPRRAFLRRTSLRVPRYWLA